MSCVEMGWWVWGKKLANMFNLGVRGLAWSMRNGIETETGSEIETETETETETEIERGDSPLCSIALLPAGHTNKSLLCFVLRGKTAGYHPQA